jgi:hypothetical protein
MKKVTLILLIIIITKYSNSQLYRIGDLKFRIFSLDSSKTDFQYLKKYKSWNITITDVLDAEELLRNSFIMHKKKPGEFEEKRKLGDYDRQYIGFIDNENHKIMRLNCFLINRELEEDEYPKHEYDVSDGGDIFFTLEIDMSARKCLRFDVNGYE